MLCCSIRSAVTCWSAAMPACSDSAIGSWSP